jgi:hypothetical protein
MFFTDSPAFAGRVLSEETADRSSAEPVDGQATLEGVLHAYVSEGYEQGYARATRDLLLLYPALIEQFLLDHVETSAEVRRGIRQLGRYLHQHIGSKLDQAGFIDGSGI